MKAKAWVTGAVPRGIDEALRTAFNEASREGLTPRSFHLGPEKWNAYRQWIKMQSIYVKPSGLPSIVVDPFRYCGIPVRPGLVHGIVVDCE